MCRGKEVSEAKVTMVPFFDNRSDTVRRVLARDHPASIGILPNVNSTKQEGAENFGTSVCSRIIRLSNNQTKSQRKDTILNKKRKQRQECCGYCENCTTIGLRLAKLGCVGFSKRQTVPVKPDAKSLGIDSKGTVHSVYATSSKYPGNETTIAWKNTSQISSSAKSLRYKI